MSHDLSFDKTTIDFDKMLDTVGQAVKVCYANVQRCSSAVEQAGGKLRDTERSREFYRDVKYLRAAVKSLEDVAELHHYLTGAQERTQLVIVNHNPNIILQEGE